METHRGIGSDDFIDEFADSCLEFSVVLQGPNYNISDELAIHGTSVLPRCSRCCGSRLPTRLARHMELCLVHQQRGRG